MKLLSHIRSRTRLKGTDDTKSANCHSPESTFTSSWAATPNPTAKFPPALLEQLLSYVCPHSRDDTYVSCEESMVDGGCMLCDMRDLSQCALVNRQWSNAAENLLYHNVRIDAVHYCDREDELAEKRRQPSLIRRGNSSDYPRDPAQQRLQLFSRTVRDNVSLANRVQFLKTPYMTREGCMADLARTVSVLRNLRYVDLPDGAYSDEPSSSILKQEVQQCADIRYMKYTGGAESNFQMLGYSRHWHNLEALELSHLAIEPSTILEVCATLTALREVKLAHLAMLNDSIFGPSINGSLPPLAKLTLQDIPNISVEGLISCLSQREAKETLKSLTIKNTGILPSELHRILASAPYLRRLDIVESVSRGLPSSALPPLASRSLRTLHYEISDANNSPRGLQTPSDSYYSYLSSSILKGSLPSLSNLYALSSTLPVLLVPPPRLSGNRTGNVPAPLISGITRPLNVHTKTISEMEWDLTLILPPTSLNHRLSAMNMGPMSLNSPALSPHWRDKGRDSVIVGNGFGGFLTVPTEETWSGSPKGKKKGRQDSGAWMG